MAQAAEERLSLPSTLCVTHELAVTAQSDADVVFSPVEAPASPNAAEDEFEDVDWQTASKENLTGAPPGCFLVVRPRFTFHSLPIPLAKHQVVGIA